MRSTIIEYIRINSNDLYLSRISRIEKRFDENSLKWAIDKILEWSEQNFPTENIPSWNSSQQALRLRVIERGDTRAHVNEGNEFCKQESGQASLAIPT